MADTLSPEEYIEWAGSPGWTTHGLPAVPDCIELDTADHCRIEEVHAGYTTTHIPHQLCGTMQSKG